MGKGRARRLGRRGFEIRYFVEVDPGKIGQRLHGARVMAASEVESLRGTFLVVAVGAPGGRQEIGGRLDQEGFVEGRDFVSVA